MAKRLVFLERLGPDLVSVDDEQTPEGIMWTVENLKAAGFDKSKRTKAGELRLGCSQCTAVAINSTPCHEHGCPNKVEETEHE